METACGEAALAVRLYRFVKDQDKGGSALAKAEFHLRGSPRPLVHAAEAEVNAAVVTESDTDAEAEEEVNIRPYLALVQGGEICDLALLSFSGGRLVEEAEEEEDEDMLLGEAWEEEAEVDAAMEEEEDDAVEPEARIQLRFCPSRQTAIFVLHYGKYWALTKQYHMTWLSEKRMKCVLAQFGELNEATIPDDVISRHSHYSLDFEICLDSSSYIQSLINAELNPCIDTDFNIIKMLAKGAEGEVHKCNYKDLTCIHFSECALKVICNAEEFCQNEPRQVLIMSRLNGAGIVKFYQAWIQNWKSDEWRAKSKCLFIHMEYCPRTLQKILQPAEHPINSNKAWAMFQEIVEAIEYMHEEGIIHYDLKSANILLSTDGRIRITDFGHSCLQENMSKDFVSGTPDKGTNFYAAPELKLGEQINEKADIFSMCAIFFDLFHCFKSSLERCKILEQWPKNGPPKEWRGDLGFLMLLMSEEAIDRPSTNTVLKHIGGVINNLCAETMNQCLANTVISSDPMLFIHAVAIRNGQIKLFSCDNEQVLLQSLSALPSKFLRFVNGRGVLLNVNADNQIEVWDIAEKELAYVHRNMKDITEFAVLSDYIHVKDSSKNGTVLKLDIGLTCMLSSSACSEPDGSALSAAAADEPQDVPGST